MASPHRAEASGALQPLAAVASVVTLHPASLERYLSLLDDLAQSLTGGKDPETASLIRALIDRILVTPYEKGQPLAFEIQGKLAPLLGLQSGGITGARREPPVSMYLFDIAMFIITPRLPTNPVPTLPFGPERSIPNQDLQRPVPAPPSPRGRTNTLRQGERHQAVAD